MRRTENFPKSFTRSANCGCLREKEQEENETQKNDRNCSFFITCFIPVDGDKNPLNLRTFRHGICCSENRREDDERK